ncbi:helix-turn-helix domain-containing protein [Pseudocitrobacter faecalis]|uniref:helix-turn-helix domain-containing protein n=1 Tax=Pseudocitrobacter faecalis TaxID=1398493 RepID=UPI003315EC56
MVTNEDRADWHRVDIVAALHKQGLSIRALSVRSGLKPDTLKNALSRAYPKAERIIADALGLPPEKIWPSRYPNIGNAPSNPPSLMNESLSYKERLMT